MSRSMTRNAAPATTNYYALSGPAGEAGKVQKATLGAALKYQEDLERARQAVPELVSRVQQPV